MYGKKRELNTTLIGIREKGVKYTLHFTAEEKIKEIYLKNDFLYRKLPFDGQNYTLAFSPEELKEMPDTFQYNLILHKQDNKETKITGKVILKR